MKISSDVIRLYKSLHTWVGITSGLLLFIGFFAGALTMFKQPLEGWALPPQQRLPLVAEARRDQLIQAVLQQYPQAQSEFTLYLQDADHVPASLVWYQQPLDGHDLALDEPLSRATLDDQGRLHVSHEPASKLAELIDMLHRTGGVPGELGHEHVGIYLMGVAGLLYGLALISGVIILLPVLVKDFLALRQGPNRKRFWLDIHNLVGITSLPFHLVIALTVVVFAFHDQFYGSLRELVYGPQPMFERPVGAESQPRNIAGLQPVAALLASIEQQAPEFTVTKLEFWNLDTPRAAVRAALVSDVHLSRGAQSGFVLLDPFTAEVTNTSALPGQEDFWSAVVATFFALHFGSFGGDSVRWIYFLMGAGGAFLFYTGNLLWVQSRRRKQSRPHPGKSTSPEQDSRSVRVMENLTHGVCLGSMTGVAVAMIGARWLPLWSSDVNGGLVWLYYLGFLSCLGWACWRGGVRAGIELVMVTALAILAIPMTSVLALLIPDAGLWLNLSWASLMVDLTAMVLGVLLLLVGGRLRIRHQPRAMSAIGEPEIA